MENTIEKRYCKLCAKELTENQIKRGKQYCGRKCAMKATYQNSELRKKVSEATKKALNNPETKQKHIEGIRKAYENSEYRQHVSEATKKALNTPEAHKKMSDAQKRIWSNEDYRNKVSEIRKEQWANKDFKENMSIKISNRWKEEGYKEKVGKKISEALNKPEVKEKRSRSLKIALSNPETKQRQRTASKLVANSPEVKQKSYETKKRNNSFNTSKPELYVKELLEQKFDKVEYQYKSDLYPFNCDFYIEDIDLYIEYNGTWTHGYKPYDENDDWCKEQLARWQEKAKTSSFYQNAIYIWTDLDVRKLKTFIDNKLNYKIFYNYEEFEQWYKAL